MLRNFADSLYSKNGAVKWFQSQSPKEEIVFASAATLLETTGTAPVGWSFRRLFQHRGVVIVTRNQLVFKNSFFSFSAMLYLFLFVLSLVMFLDSRDWDYLFVLIFLGMLIAQFLPYQKQIPLKAIRKAKLGTVAGFFSMGSLLTVYFNNKVLTIVPAQLLSEEVVQVILSKKKVYHSQESA